MVLHFVGLGLGDENDITIKGLEVIKQCDFVYLEAYTSVLSVGKARLEQFYGKKLLIADRETVENDCEAILTQASQCNVALLVVGDPFGATTHMDIFLRAKKKGIPINVVHNASIMNAVGCCGLQLYNFGPSTTIVFFEPNWKPDSFYEKIEANKLRCLHTLCLLDIKTKEQTMENLLRGNKIYEPPRFMSLNLCIEQLLEIEQKHQRNVCTKFTHAIGLARVGQLDQRIVAGTLEELRVVDFGPPLHCLVIPGTMHFLEQECFDHFRVNQVTANKTTSA